MVSSLIQHCVERVAEKLNIKNYSFVIEGESSKGDGYLGDISFVIISGTTENNINKDFSIVIKTAAKSNPLRERIPIRDCFIREIHHYESTVPVFTNLQKEKSVQGLLNFIPQIYFTQKTEFSEFVALENLKLKGFNVWNRRLPMTFEHIRLILTAYGQWHALSFVLKQENLALFEKLTANNINMISELTKKMDLFDFHLDNIKYARDKAISTKSEAYKSLQFTKEDIKYALIDSFFDDLEDSVILHGDCWNNNFLFKTDVTTNQPSEVKIIDWQCTSLGSPVIDLSHFIYCCVDTKSFKNVDVLLKIYFKSLSTTLATFGCNANDVFSYEKLLKHWQKFQKFGLFFGCFMLKLSISDSEETVDMLEVAEKGETYDKAFRIDIKNEAEFLQRAKNNLIFYVSNLTK